MKKVEIEGLVHLRVHEAIEKTVAACIEEINAAGHAFVPIPDALLEWQDRTRGQRLMVSCGLSTCLEEGAAEEKAQDPEVEAFIALAESGTSREASVLNQLEGDIANGGFAQLFDNKDTEFVREGLEYLQDIGAQASAKLVKQALTLVENNSRLLQEYERLQAALRRLDIRFNERAENLAELYWRKQQAN